MRDDDLDFGAFGGLDLDGDGKVDIIEYDIAYGDDNKSAGNKLNDDFEEDLEDDLMGDFEDEFEYDEEDEEESSELGEDKEDEKDSDINNNSNSNGSVITLSFSGKFSGEEKREEHKDWVWTHSAKNIDFNSPLDYYDAKYKSWHIKEALLDRFPKETEMCDLKDKISDFIREIYLNNQEIGFKAWLFLVNIFKKDILKMENKDDNWIYHAIESPLQSIIYYDLGNQVPNNKYIYDYFKANLSYLYQFISDCSEYSVERLLYFFARYNDFNIVKRIMDLRVTDELSPENGRRISSLTYKITRGLAYLWQSKIDYNFYTWLITFYPLMKKKDALSLSDELEKFKEQGYFHQEK